MLVMVVVGGGVSVLEIMSGEGFYGSKGFPLEHCTVAMINVTPFICQRF